MNSNKKTPRDKTVPVAIIGTIGAIIVALITVFGPLLLKKDDKVHELTPLPSHVQSPPKPSLTKAKNDSKQQSKKGKTGIPQNSQHPPFNQNNTFQGEGGTAQQAQTIVNNNY